VSQRIVTTDESWCFQLDPGKNSPQQKMIRKIRVSVLTGRYLDVTEVIPGEFIPGGTTAKSHCYLEVMERL
jgi:hypothetical protein